MKRKLAAVAAVAGFGLAVAAVPASARPTVPTNPGVPGRCQKVGRATDDHVARLGKVPGASLEFVLPNGKTVLVDGETDPLTVAYVSSRGKLARMCG